jgi:hypothetical protein
VTTRPQTVHMSAGLLRVGHSRSHLGEFYPADFDEQRAAEMPPSTEAGRHRQRSSSVVDPARVECKNVSVQPQLQMLTTRRRLKLAERLLGFRLCATLR